MNNKRKEKHGVSLITLADQRSPISEQYRTIRTNIQFSMVDKSFKTLVVTSPGQGEGKSTTSANLAVVFANSEVNVLLVDADLRKPTVAKTFGLKNHLGLSTLLTDRALTIEEAVQPSGVNNLSILTSGPKPPNPSEMLGSHRMNHMLHSLQEKYDLIIFDMPPVATVADAQIMSSMVDGTVLVVREEVTDKREAIKAKQLLELSNAHLLGVICNGATKDKDSSYYYGD